MNEKKISFIIAVYDEEAYNKCVRYLSELVVPDGFEADVIAVKETNSIAEAYNTGMNSSDSQYKVYLKETTLLYNRNFIGDMMKVFASNLGVGLLGVSGTKIIPTTGICQEAKKRAGKVINRTSGEVLAWSETRTLFEKVQSIDGCVMATQYDIRWREDLFNENWFYDVSQSLEFKRAGYIVAVAQQKEAWAAIDCNAIINEKDRNIFLDEYSRDVFPLVSILITTYNRPKYFRIALESAIHQTYRNIEIIIGDDSTNDETQKIMEDYLSKYKNITYFKNGGSTRGYQGVIYRGYANCMNILHRSKGEYINYLNDDDVFHLNKISKMMSCFLEYPNISLVTSYRQAIDKDGNQIPNCIPHIFKEDTLLNGNQAGRQMLLSTINFIGEPTTVLIKKKYIDHNIGTFAGFTFLALIDMAQWLESLQYGDAIYIQEALSYFRIHEGQNQKDDFMHLICLNEEMQCVDISFEKNLYLNDESEYLQIIGRIFNQQKGIDFIKSLPVYQKSKFYNEKILDEYSRNRGKYLSLLPKTCAACSNRVAQYIPLPNYYAENLQKVGIDIHQLKPEMLNMDEYTCPYCGSSDRERAYILWMKKNWKSDITLKMLDIAPSPVIRNFIKSHFINVDYKTADLFMPNVDYKIDIMDMKEIPNKSFNFFICSHVMEHVADDVKAMRELKRILKDEGCGILVAPVDLDQKEIDEDPTCTSVAERWRRFGQDDHIRKYSKNGFLDRIQKSGLNVKEHGITYFGEVAFNENAITKTSVVYIVAK